MRPLAMSAIVLALAVAAAGCAKAPPAPPPPAPQDNASGSADSLRRDKPVVIIDGRPLVVVPSTRIQPPPPAPAPPASPSTDASATASVEPQTTVVEEPAPPASLPPARPLRPVKVIVIDAGHGGENTGATQGGLVEKEVNLDVSLKLAAELRRRGFTVIMTRTEDDFLGLEERAALANTLAADLFICMHSNAAANTEACGIEVYYAAEIFHQNGRAIDDVARARDVAARDLPDGPFTWGGDQGPVVTPATLSLNRDLGRALGLEIERALTRDLDAPTRGVKPAGYEVLRWAACPAVLVEMGFLTNENDCAKLAEDAYRARIAKAVAKAVGAYANLAPPGARE